MFNRRYFLQSSIFSSLGLLAGRKASAVPGLTPATSLASAPELAPVPSPDPASGLTPAPSLTPAPGLTPATSLASASELAPSSSLDLAPASGLTPAPSLAPAITGQPVVISTWDAGLAANKGAWEVLSRNGAALDAVEAGVKVTEASQNCCVGLGANPDRDGYVTLDASIMDHEWNCGAVGFLERIKHPISVARRVMEKTPHVMLVGVGAQEFAVAEGFPLEPAVLSNDAKKTYDQWLKKSEYKPVINIENSKGDHSAAPGPDGGLPGDRTIASADPSAGAINAAPSRLPDGGWNHDTIGMVAMDATGNLSGSCTTSGMGFKMRGRLGDSPIIGAGLFVDNEVGAVTATGQGEDVIRVCGSHSVVEYMRQGMSPEEACKAAVEKIARIKKEKAKDIQVAFIALNKKGETGAYALQKGFTYALRNNNEERMVQVKSYF